MAVVGAPIAPAVGGIKKALFVYCYYYYYYYLFIYIFSALSSHLFFIFSMVERTALCSTEYQRRQRPVHNWGNYH